MTSRRSLFPRSPILVLLLIGCGDPMGPTTTPVPRLEVQMDYPAAPPSAEVYDRLTPSSVVGHSSRYVLYDDNAFELQYLTDTGRLVTYPGEYARSGPAIAFDFDGWSAAGPWRAVGTLEQKRLHVEYNIVMWLTDFENGVYVLRADD